ncbi:MAG: hypothetical protein AAF198_12435 [Pseudomonadota bacterium]
MKSDDLLTAFKQGDRRKIMQLYWDQGVEQLAAGDEDAGCFYLVHAYVFALEEGAAEAEIIRRELKKRGREA